MDGSKIKAWLKAKCGKLYTGAVLHVFHRGKDVFFCSVGKLDPRKEAPVTVGSFFDLASLTKVLVTLIILYLLDQKLLQKENTAVSLASTVADLLPEYAATAWAEVTLMDLMAHRSGMPHSCVGNIFESGEWRRGREALLKRLQGLKPAYERGKGVIYSCANYLVLGEILQKLSGKSLEILLEEHIRKPLEISGLTCQLAEDVRRQTAITVYDRPHRGALVAGDVHDPSAFLLGQQNVTGYFAANAGLFGTAAAVSRLGQLALGPGFLSKETWRLMVTCRAEDCGELRGLGWRLWDTHFLGDLGFSSAAFGLTGFTGTSLVVDPAKKLVITFLTNAVHYYENNCPTENGSRWFDQWRREIHQLVLRELVS